VAGYSNTKVDRAGRTLAEQGDWKEEATAIVDWWRAEHESPLLVVAANLYRYAGEEGDPVVAHRLKRVPTIVGKLQREKRMRLSRMEDIGGVRAILPDQQAVYRIARLLRRNWTITRFRDYVRSPKSDGYRALHLVNRHRGRAIEIQLRTPGQDEWANAVEGATQAHPDLKSGGGPAVLKEFFVAASEITAIIEGSIDMPSVARMLELQEAITRADIFTSGLSNDS
jgi:putative GTP pyrophosphokinase